MTKAGKNLYANLRRAGTAGSQSSGGATPAKATAQASGWRSLLAVIIICAVIGVAPELKAALITPPSRIATGSYQFLVDDMVAHNLFSLSGNANSSGAQQVVINRAGITQLCADTPEPGSGCDIASASTAEERAAALTAAVEAMRRATYLKVDMADAASPVWRYDDGLLLAGTVPGARNLAVARVAGVGREPRLLLAGESQQFLVRGSAGGRPIEAALGTAAMQSLPLTAVAKDARAPAYNPARPPMILCLPVGVNGNRCQDEVAIIRTNDGGLLLRAPARGANGERSAAVSVEIDGEPVETGENAVVRALAPRQPVTLQWGDGRADFEIVERTIELGDLPGMTGIAAAVLASRPRGDVQTAIRADVHLAAQQALDRLDVLRNAGSQRNSVRASATFIDGWTGEIVAVPTFPHREAQLGNGPGERRFRQDWLTSNMALTPMVVGSVAKVPFAATLLRTYPDLRTARYKAPDAGDIRTVGGEVLTSDGSPIEPGIENLHGTREFGFREFIAESNNYFALAMMRRGSGTNGGNGVSDWAEAFWAYNCAIASEVTSESDARAGLDQWFGKGICARTLWPGIEPSRPIALDAAQIAPVSLNLENVPWETSNYPTYYISVLGSGRSLWSTIALARAYSRIVTGRQIEARFTAVANRDAAEPRELFEGPDRLTLLHAGMQDVVRTRTGSGYALAASLTEFPGFDVYAKTGSFQLETSAASNRYPCIHAYLRNGGALRPGARGRGVRPVAEASPCAVTQIAALNRDEDDLARFLAEADEQSGLIRTMPILTRLVPGNGNALVLVFRCRAADKSDHVRTIAINIQATQAASERQDIVYARTILSNAAVRNWIGRC